MEKIKLFLKSDLCWNYISVGLVAVGGLLFSVILIAFYDANVVGRFNTVYAYYIVLSQFCVMGVHTAITKYVALYKEDAVEQSKILFSGIVVVIISSIIIVTFIWLISKLRFYFFISYDMWYSIYTILPALVFFSINKVILGFFNGILKMKAYAFFQGIRNVAIALIIVGLSLIHFDGKLLPIAFLGAEVIIFLGEMGYFLLFKRIKPLLSFEWVKRLASFGIKILPGNVVLELNTKVDVLCLSMLGIEEGLIGIYSFAALFAEGFYQLLVVIRRMINPKLSYASVNGVLSDEISEFNSKYKKVIGIGSFIIAILVVLAEVVIVMVMRRLDYIFGLKALIILNVSIAFNYQSIIFGNILSQVGFPEKESVLNIMTVIANIVLNILCIRIWGITGAAIATGVSYFAFRTVQDMMLKKQFGKYIIYDEHK